MRRLGGPSVRVGIGPDCGLEQRSLAIACEPLLQHGPGAVLIWRAAKSQTDR